MIISEPLVEEMFPEVEIYFRENIRTTLLGINEKIREINESIRIDNEEKAFLNEQIMQQNEKSKLNFALFGLPQPRPIPLAPLSPYISPKSFEGINICCTPEERDFLKSMAIHLKSEFPLISNKDICIAIVYTYYGLNLTEQSEDYMTKKIYQDYADNPKDVELLYMYIGTSIEHPIFTHIRRYFFGMPPPISGGGKSRKSKSRKSKSRKSRNKNKENDHVGRWFL